MMLGLCTRVSQTVWGMDKSGGRLGLCDGLVSRFLVRGIYKKSWELWNKPLGSSKYEGEVGDVRWEGRWVVICEERPYRLGDVLGPNAACCWGSVCDVGGFWTSQRGAPVTDPASLLSPRISRVDTVMLVPEWWWCKQQEVRYTAAWHSARSMPVNQPNNFGVPPSTVGCHRRPLWSASTEQ